MNYSTHYLSWLKKVGANIDALPIDLQILIEKYERAYAALQSADIDTQQHLLLILAQADAVISAGIYSLFKPRIESAQVNKVKLMVLKAKALKLKWIAK